MTMAKGIQLCKVHSYIASANLCQHTTMWSIDASNCYITLSCCLK